MGFLDGATPSARITCIDIKAFAEFDQLFTSLPPLSRSVHFGGGGMGLKPVFFWQNAGTFRMRYCIQQILRFLKPRLKMKHSQIRLEHAMQLI